MNKSHASFKRYQRTYSFFKHSVFVLPFIFMSMIVASKIDNGTMWLLKLFILGTLCAVTAKGDAHYK